ncbi:cytochrome P450 [Pisolithus marmoratus]|nr:cytochrome P450 [Pisolithus marmoratus]
MQIDMLLSPLSWAGVGTGITFIAVYLYRTYTSPNLDRIPTVGQSGLIGAIRFLTHSIEIVQEGYEKHKTGIFKVADLTHRWTVVLNRSHLDDMAKAGDNELSFIDVANENIHVEYTLSPAILHDQYHNSILRSQLTTNVGAIYPDIRNELVVAFDEALDLDGNEWKSVTAIEMIRNVVCRVHNRVFVGLPLCRDPDWVDLLVRLTVALVQEGALLMLVPKFIKPLAARWITRRNERISRAARLLEPVIRDRQKHMKEYGKEWSDKPNDLLQWCLDEGRENTADQLAVRLMAINFAAIQTTSNGFAQALFLLATDPQYAEMLRGEVEMVVKEHGWTKAALTRMRKIDSFLKEVQRFQGPVILGVPRKALQDIRLSDGTVIPKGTFLSVPTYAIHHDQDIYENPDVFDPLRFVRLKDTSQNADSRFQLAAVSRESLTFGFGKMTCPGKAFAAVIMKSMLAHVVMEYDVKLDGDSSSSLKGIRFGIHLGPDPAVRVMIRKRSA